jgi:lycopene cyclase domain-containing protein
VLDSMAHISKTYVVESMFSFKLIATPVECYIWGVLFCILVLAGYEYFFDSTSTKKLSANHKYAIIILTTGFALFIATYILMPIKLNISYFYLIYTAIVLAIDFVILSKAKKIFTIALTYSVLFFPFYVIHEITALKQGYWTFHYENLVGGVPIFGFIVPIEELLFFIITPILVIGCYELFADNQKAMK